MSGLIGRLKRLIRRGLGQKAGLRHDWREVVGGPLKGVWFYLPSGEDARWADRFLTGGYEPEMLAALEELARVGGTLYDVGAHTGFYTCAWLKFGGERVEAFEPAAYNRQVLEATLRRNDFADKVRVHALALGDRDGEAILLASREDVGAASAAYLQDFGGVELPPGVQAGPLPALERVTVPVRRLDAIVAEMELHAATVLKFDIEGAEAAALAGAETLLERWHPAILCEVHSVENALVIADRMAQADYKLQVLGKNGPT
ncbi:MAG: FkbM family methyltransferase [Chloroflexia bacterium]